MHRPMHCHIALFVTLQRKSTSGLHYSTWCKKLSYFPTAIKIVESHEKTRNYLQTCGVFIKRMLFLKNDFPDWRRKVEHYYCIPLRSCRQLPADARPKSTLPWRHQSAAETQQTLDITVCILTTGNDENPAELSPSVPENLNKQYAVVIMQIGLCIKYLSK